MLASLLAGCTTPGETGSWVGTITTEGDVTTVVNETGSVWGASAELVEELSIGVESGEAEYMFGEITAVHVDDVGIWVVDEQTPAVRLFDVDGAHVRDIGGRGEGPGEFTRPQRIATSAAGRVFVADAGTNRINVYSAEGVYVEALPLDRGVVWGGYIPLAIDAQGRPLLVYRDYDLLDPAERSAPRYVIRAHDGSGPIGEPIPVPSGQRAFPGAGRFRPAWAWNVSPSGDLMSGSSDVYRFEMGSTDGTTRIVEKAWEPVAVAAEEAAYFEHLRTLGNGTRRADPTPDTKPAFLALLGSATGEIWVLRQGPGVKLEGCNDRPASQAEWVEQDRPCWLDSLLLDVFGDDGRFLGRVDVREEMVDQILRWARTPHFAGDRVTAVTIDDAGTIAVKRYRVVRPDR